MRKLKKEFEIQLGQGDLNAGHSLEVKIIDGVGGLPMLAIYGQTSLGATNVSGYLAGEELKLLATNILKELKRLTKPK